MSAPKLATEQIRELRVAVLANAAAALKSCAIVLEKAAEALAEGDA
jgi:hypothetical protein